MKELKGWPFKPLDGNIRPLGGGVPPGATPG
jgi:hypothetical protein